MIDRGRAVSRVGQVEVLIRGTVENKAKVKNRPHLDIVTRRVLVALQEKFNHLGARTNALRSHACLS